MLKVAVALPSTNTGWVKVTDGSLQSTTIENPAIAGALRVIVPVDGFPPGTSLGLRVNV